MYQGARRLGEMPPQASTNGYGRLGQLPPQASTNGLGRYGMIGMMPPQAQAGMGADMSPISVDEPRAFRDGLFGRRAPLPFAELDRPWNDGIFSGPLSGSGGPQLTLSPQAVLELKTALNLLIPSYSMTEGSTYDVATEAAYSDYANTQTPGFADKAELFLDVSGQWYPSARGIYVLMQGARLRWLEEVGEDASYTQVASFYPILWQFASEFQAASMTGSIQIPASVTAAPPGVQPARTVKPSTAAILGIGSIALGLLYLMMRKPKRSVTPNRRRRRRRR